MFLGALCVASLALGTHAGAAEVSEYAPPPPIPLDAAPAPELAPLEYSRRPFELAPEFALALPSGSDGSRSVRLGTGFGLAALWRPTPFVALGGSATRFSVAEHAHAGFYGVLGRVYVSDHGVVDPYLELGLGAAGARTGAARAGGGVEFFLGRHVRVGPAIQWTAIRADTDLITFSLRLSLLFGPGA